MHRCDTCQNNSSCDDHKRQECFIRDDLFYRPAFLGRCDNCGAPLYADSMRYHAQIGRQTLELCEACCKRA